MLLSFSVIGIVVIGTQSTANGNASIVTLGPLPIPNIANYHNPNVRKKKTTNTFRHFYMCLYKSTKLLYMRKLLYTWAQATPKARRRPVAFQPIKTGARQNGRFAGTSSPLSSSCMMSRLRAASRSAGRHVPQMMSPGMLSRSCKIR